MSSGLLRILVISLVLLAAAVMMMPRRTLPPPESATELPQTLPLPEIPFIDHTGTPFSSAQLENRFSLLFFGFTNCPDICPLTLQVLAQALTQLREQTSIATPQVVLISVDPTRDTPERLAAYIKNFDTEFIGLTAPDAALKPLLTTLGVSVMKQSLGGEQYNMTHNSQIFVTNPNGAVIAIFSSAKSPELVATDFVRIRGRYLRGMGAAATQ